MNILPSLTISFLLACATAIPYAYSYSIYDIDDDDFGFEGGVTEIKAGYYIVTKDTIYFKMRDLKQAKRSSQDDFGFDISRDYEDYDHKSIKKGQRVYLISADYPQVAQIRSKGGKKLYIQLKDVASEKEYKALQKEKKETELVLEKWNELKETLAPCPRQGNACAIENTPAFKYRSDVVNFVSIKGNDKMRKAFAKNQTEKEAAVMLGPAEIINIISWESSDDHDFVKLVSESGDVLYADPTHLRALPKKDTEE